MYGKGHAFRAGTISGLKDKTVYGYVKGYCEQYDAFFTRAETERLVAGGEGVKRTTGQHPGGIVIVPEGYEIFDFTPIQYPADKKEKKAILEELKTESRTMILYEAPHHLIRTLEELYAALGERRITLCRELTKKFETVFPTTLEKALDYYKTEEPRGEYVLVVEGKSPEEKRQEEIASWESMSIEEHMAYYEEQGMDNKSAMKQVAKDRGVGKREIYQYLHGNS